MIDNPTAAAKVGNIFDYVLIASERFREINRQRSASGENGLPTHQYKNLPKIHHVVAEDIESGRVGREYLKRISDRANRHRRELDTMR
jgi:hypothetical protein